MPGSRKALLFVVALGAIAVVWAASRYSSAVTARGHETRSGATAAPAEGANAADTLALRFYRDPTAVAPFSAKDLDGRDVSSAAFHGKVVIVNFWATWCGPCRAEIPDLIALQEKYRDQLQIVGVSEDEAPPETVKRFAVEHRMNYPIVMTSDPIRKLFPGVSALPTSFVLDRESRLVQKHVGMLRAATTEQETRYLAGLPTNAAIEEVDRAEGLKLENGAQLVDIPGVELGKLPVAKRVEALQKLNAESCTCGCDLTVAKCRVDDPNCGISLPLARQIVSRISAER